MRLLIPVISLLCFQLTLGAVTIEGVTEGQTILAVVDESPMFKCMAPSGTTLEWTTPDTFGMVLSGEPPRVISSAEIGGVANSYLTIEGATEDDSERYKCRDASNPGDSVTFTLSVVASGGMPEGWTAPQIRRTNPTSDEVHVGAGGELELRCTGGSADSNLVFEKDGTVIVDHGTVISLTQSTDVNLGGKILLMTHPAEDGTYTCKDANHASLPTDSVTVVVGTEPTVQVDITEPSGSVHKVMEGERFSIKCQAPRGTQLAWYLGQDMLQDETGGYLVGGTENVATGLVTSLLTKEEAAASDAGNYRCVNADNADQGDSIQVDVRVPGEEDDDDDDDDGFLSGLFGGVTGLGPSMVVLLVSALLSLGWIKN